MRNDHCRRATIRWYGRSDSLGAARSIAEAVDLRRFEEGTGTKRAWKEEGQSLEAEAAIV